MMKRLPLFLGVFFYPKMANDKRMIGSTLEVIYNSNGGKRNGHYFVRSPYADFLASFVDLIQKYLNSLKRLIMPVNRHSRVLLVNKGV